MDSNGIETTKDGYIEKRGREKKSKKIYIHACKALDDT
jgi:hypothetical protein